MCSHVASLRQYLCQMPPSTPASACMVVFHAFRDYALHIVLRHFHVLVRFCGGIWLLMGMPDIIIVLDKIDKGEQENGIV